MFARQAYTALCSNVLFPLHELAKGHDSVARRRALEKSQWWPREKLEEHRIARLREFLRRAGANVPYYRRMFHEAGFDAGAVQDVAALSVLPLLTKDLIRSNVDSLRDADGRGLKRFSTGGSSGQPLTFYLDNERVSHDVAAKWRATRWWGVDFGDPEIVAWGSPIELHAQDWVRSARDRLFRSTLLPAFEMSEASLLRYVATIRRKRPTMLFGYPSVLAHIAGFAEERGHVLSDLGVRVAFVTAERLYDDQRERIARVFGCAVANSYGGRDAGLLAYECPSGSMHTSAEDVVIEIVDACGAPAGAGTPGEIVVTHMASGGFPFIRYPTGDIAVMDDRRCECGRGLPLLKEIQGRTTDFVVARDGTVMHGLALIYVVRELPGIAKFKIVQESLGRTSVLLVKGQGFLADAAAKIRDGMTQRLGKGVEIDVQIVDDIPQESSGKFRYVMSKVR